MFFRPKKNRPTWSSGLAGVRGNRVADETIQRAAIETWRESEQRVTRAWNTWLASGRPERSRRYRAYEAALEDEAQAAEQVERMLQIAAAGQQAESNDG